MPNYLEILRLDSLNHSQRTGDKYRRWARVTKGTMRIQHKPGDAIQVDWAGGTLPVYDPITGEQSSAYLFVAVQQLHLRGSLRRYEDRELAELSRPCLPVFWRCATAADSGQLQNCHYGQHPIRDCAQPQLPGACRILRYSNRSGPHPQAPGQERGGSIRAFCGDTDHCGTA